MRKTALLSALLLLPLATSAWAQPVRYLLDPEHTSVMFRLDHVGFTRSIGWFGKVEGELVFDAANPSASKVEARIGAATIATNHEQRDTWVRSDKVLDTAKNPTISFVSSKVTVDGDKKGKVEGILTIRGVAKPVTLNVTFGKQGVNPINKKETVGFSAQARLKRSEFGINAFLGPLGDEIDIAIEAEAIKAP